MSTQADDLKQAVLDYSRRLARGVQQTEVLLFMGAFWKGLRTERGVEIEEVATKMQASTKEVELFEQGLVVPNEEFVNRLARALGRQDCLATHVALFEGYQ